MQALPYYIAIGMPTDEFWNGEPQLINVYREAHELEVQQRNQEMWWQGAYFHRALNVVADKFGQSLAGKNGKTTDYPSEPVPLTKHEQEMSKERNKQRTLQWVEKGQH